MVYYPLSDLLYRTVALTDTGNDVVEAYDTDTYGNTLVYSGPGADDTWFTDDDVNIDDDPARAWPLCRFIFTGREYDFETYIYHYRARCYHPQLGRLISRDPLGGPTRDRRYGRVGQPNLYNYAIGNPTLYIDPAGLQAALDAIIDPDTLSRYGPEEIEQFRGAIKDPAFSGRDAPGLTARARHVLKALVICSRQSAAKKAAQKLAEGYNTLMTRLVSGQLTYEQYERAMKTVSATLHAQGASMSAVTRGMNELGGKINVVPGGIGGGGVTDPKNLQMALPADRGLPGTTDPQLPPPTVPPRVRQECFDSKWPPTGLMALAAEVVAEMPHFMAGSGAVRQKLRDAQAQQIWNAVDCCCLKQLLGP